MTRTHNSRTNKTQPRAKKSNNVFKDASVEWASERERGKKNANHIIFRVQCQSVVFRSVLWSIMMVDFFSLHSNDLWRSYSSGSCLKHCKHCKSLSKETNRQKFSFYGNSTESLLSSSQMHSDKRSHYTDIPCYLLIRFYVTFKRWHQTPSKRQ